MKHLSDEDIKIIEEEILFEADRRRHDRFWDNHQEFLSAFSPKTRNKILDIEFLIIAMVIFIFIHLVLTH